MIKKAASLFIVCLCLISCTQDKIEQGLKFSGTLELTEHSLGARAAGRLSALFVDDGDEVKAGQLLATLDRFEQSKKDFLRSKELFQGGGVTQQDLEYAQLAMEDQEVVSAVDGVVLVKVHEVGEVVGAGTSVVVVGDRKRLWVKIYVPEEMINKIQMNQSAVLRFDGLSEEFSGHVRFIASRAEFTPRNVQTQEERIIQTFAVKVVLDNPPPYLRPGVAADVVIHTKE